MYVVIKDLHDNKELSWTDASKKAGYGDRSAYYALRDKLIEDGFIDEAGELTDKAGSRLAGTEESPVVEDYDEDEAKEAKDPEGQEDPFHERTDQDLEARHVAADGGTATRARSREHRFQVALSEPVRACLEAEAKMEHIKASQKISMILTEYYRQKNKIKE